MSESLENEIAREIEKHTILVYGKGTKDAPRCGFTHETIQFFNHFGYPFEVLDVLENMPKRDALAKLLVALDKPFFVFELSLAPFGKSRPHLAEVAVIEHLEDLAGALERCLAHDGIRAAHHRLDWRLWWFSYRLGTFWLLARSRRRRYALCRMLCGRHLRG